MTYISSWLHCVFSTKERRPVLTPPLQERLWPFVRGIARENRMKAIRYIQGQEQHHRGGTFQEEFPALLKKHRIEYDERYLWD